MGAGEHRDVLEAVRMVANDRGWLRRLREAAMTGLTAEAAVERVQNDASARMQRQTDPYLRDRLHDLDDLANRLLHQLTGQSYVADRDSVPENAIIVARNMGPAALLDYDRAKLRGLILEEGGPASHVAIVARALGVATVGLVPNITGLVEPGDAMIIDGSTGDVHVRPQPDVQTAYAEKARLRARRQEQYAQAARRSRRHQGRRRDRAAYERRPAPSTRHSCARPAPASIGLFRTELQFMLAPRFPRMKEQYQFYKAVLDAVPDRPVTFRTLDIGSDKVLPYMAKIDEENPALGWRAIRIGLDRPGLLRLQLRAMLQGRRRPRSAHHVPDDRQCRGIRSRQGDHLAGNGVDPPARPRDADASSNSAPWWRCRPCCGSWIRSPSAPISSRSAPTISCNIFTPPTATTRASPSAMTISRRQCCAPSKASSTPATARARR